MKKITILIISLFVLFIFGCRYFSVFDYSVRDATKYLQKQGVDEQTINKIISGEKLSYDEFLHYSKSSDPYVRFFIARNPNIPIQILKTMKHDWSKSVVNAVAQNRSIDDNLINYFYKNNIALCALVANPSVPQEIILDIFHNRHKNKVQLSDFALNSKCPQEIINAIESSDDQFAKEMLYTYLQK